MDKLLISKKTTFEAGSCSLQEHCTLAIQSHLMLIVKSKLGFAVASEQAAQSHGMAAVWGGRMLHSWTCAWISLKQLPTSRKGKHEKSYSLLDDPAIATELRDYVRSNKWAMDPEKLAQFSKNELVSKAVNEYFQQINNHKMPKGLKEFMELTLFPRIQLKVSRGISLSTARCWLRCEGFQYTGHKKGLYFDGHDRADIVAYRQDVFLP